jgi:hypothetical protein
MDLSRTIMSVLKQELKNIFSTFVLCIKARGKPLDQAPQLLFSLFKEEPKKGQNIKEKINFIWYLIYAQI